MRMTKEMSHMHSFGVSTPLKGFEEDVDEASNSLSLGTTHSVFFLSRNL